MKKILKILCVILVILISILLIIFLYHQISNLFTRSKLEVPGDLIEVYDDENIHCVKLDNENSNNTIIMLPGMGTASPYYDYYYLAEELSKTNNVIIIEPLGYGFSDNTSKERKLKDYEYEISKVLEYYNINNNIYILNHSYSGIESLYYANNHSEVKGIVCLDCTTAYQIETHVENGKFKEEVPVYSNLMSLSSPLGLTRIIYTISSKSVYNDLVQYVPEKYQDNYKYFLYNKSYNKTIVNELNDIPYNQLELLNEKYNENLKVITFLSSETVESMKEYKKDGDFLKDWEEMHNELISNNEIQKIYVLEGDHYIYHNNINIIVEKVNKMINDN